MPGWVYRVPRLDDSRWRNAGGPRTVRDPDWPVVGVFCDAESHDLWLLGSLTVSAEVTQQLGRIHWGWQDKYPTGDGYFVNLGWQARKDGSDSTQFLVGDQPYDQDLSSERLRVALESGDFTQMEAASEESEREEAEMRSRIVMECQECGDRVVRRSDTVHSTMTAVWGNGVRELSLTGMRRVFDAAKH